MCASSRLVRRLSAAACALVAFACMGVVFGGCVETPAPDAAPGAAPAGGDTGRDTIRVMTYNIEDVRTRDLLRPDHPRLRRAAAVIQHLRPDVLLVNEMTYDQPGDPGYRAGEAPGQNARRFARQFLAVSQADTLAGLRYAAFTAPVNTGLASGFDLNRDGRAVTTVPPIPPPPPSGAVAPQTAAGRAYGNDAWGFGTFPGQYGMALFVREGLTVVLDSVRTFRRLPWRALPGALRPADPATGEAWYGAEAWAALRLSSKSHWDVPVRLPSGAVVHILASHPTPPAFDGDEQRNVKRNHDEIRFWRDYLDGAPYVVDDSSRAGGLPGDAAFVLVGDLNADPDAGNATGDPIRTHLFTHPRVQATAPTSAVRLDGRDGQPLAATATARFGLRVDYALPSANLALLATGLYRPPRAPDAPAVSDHFPVWVDVVLE